MGFYPYMKGKIERVIIDGEHKVKAEVFDSVLNRWSVKEFPGYDVALATAWIADKMNQLEM